MDETRSTIVYIGDDKRTGDQLEQSLTKKGYTFRQVTKGSEGIEIASRDRPDFILVDVSLPDMDSAGLIARLRIIPGLKSKPIIIVASHSQLDGRRLALISGCDGYLAKPIVTRQLFAQISRFLDTALSAGTTNGDSAHSANMLRQLELRVEELTRQNEQLRQENEQLQDLDQRRSKFFSVVSHDLRTPFTPIRGYLDLVRDGAMGELNPKQRHAINIVSDNLKNALRLLDDLLDLSKLQAKGISLSLELFSIRELLEEMDRSGKTYVEKNDVEFKMEVADDLPLIRGDRKRIRQVILNLLNNAAKFTDHGSITLIAKADENNVTICVKDTGSGLMPEEIPQVFDEFWRSETIRASGLGTGLGLAISRHLVQAHKGKIWLESEKGVGTTISFTIPIAKTEDSLAVRE